MSHSVCPLATALSHVLVAVTRITVLSLLVGFKSSSRVTKTQPDRKGYMTGGLKHHNESPPASIKNEVKHRRGMTRANKKKKTSPLSSKLFRYTQYPIPPIPCHRSVPSLAGAARQGRHNVLWHPNQENKRGNEEQQAFLCKAQWWQELGYRGSVEQRKGKVTGRCARSLG
jgi:hypothetical protein